MNAYNTLCLDIARDPERMSHRGDFIGTLTDDEIDAYWCDPDNARDSSEPIAEMCIEMGISEWKFAQRPDALHEWRTALRRYAVVQMVRDIELAAASESSAA